MIKCIIVDDEPLAIQLIESYVEQLDGIQTLSSFQNPLEAVNFTRSNDIDLIFLDIQMPELNGLDVAKILDKDINVIFTTAFPNYAVEGFEVQAVDYLVKPISFIRFVEAVNRLLEQQQQTTENTPAQADYLFVKTEYRLKKIDLNDIIYLKGMGDYCAIVMTDSKVMTLEKLKSFVARLPSKTFCRVHKSYIVAIDRIDYIEKSRIHIDDQIIPIGSTFESQFMKLLK